MNKFKSGIYKITINDYYIYIGQSMDVKSRWSAHLSELKRNRHRNTKLQNVFNKYFDTIKFEVVEYCDVNMLDEREIYWIDYYRSYGSDHGLNLSIGGNCGSRKYKTKEEAEVARKENNKEYRKTHEEERKEYRKTHKKETKQYNKQYYKTHEEERKQYAKQYRRQKGVLPHSQRFKLQFEKRHKLSRSLTDEEWNIWKSTKNKQKYYAIKFLNTLPNITFLLKNC